MLQYNGSKDIIDHRWRLLNFNAPRAALAPTNDSKTAYQDGAVFCNAFQDILKDPQEYQEAENVVPAFRWKFSDNITELGLLTNTFLVIDPVCIDSILHKEGRQTTGWERYDDMRILAFEAEFPVQGRKYVEGYQGFTWVRLDQLVYHFYELRLLKTESFSMDEIWQAAQVSRHQAFVSTDPEEASSYTRSSTLGGFTRDSVLGRRWYAVEEAKKARQG